MNSNDLTLRPATSAAVLAAAGRFVLALARRVIQAYARGIELQGNVLAQVYGPRR